MKFILHPEHKSIRGNCIAAISELDEGKTWDISIKQHIQDKTAEQRNWYHKLCTLFGDEVGMTKAEIKEITKGRLFGLKTVSYGGIDMVIAAGRSEGLNLAEYSALIDSTYQLAGEAGIVLPPADRFRRE